MDIEFEVDRSPQPQTAADPQLVAKPEPRPTPKCSPCCTVYVHVYTGHLGHCTGINFQVSQIQNPNNSIFPHMAYM